MREPVRARRLTDQEGSRLQQIVRRGKQGSVVRVRRVMIIWRRRRALVHRGRMLHRSRDTGCW